jgi:hypothetical protein
MNVFNNVSNQMNSWLGGVGGFMKKDKPEPDADHGALAPVALDASSKSKDPSEAETESQNSAVSTKGSVDDHEDKSRLVFLLLRLFFVTRS